MSDNLSKTLDYESFYNVHNFVCRILKRDIEQSVTGCMNTDGRVAPIACRSLEAFGTSLTASGGFK